MRNPGLTVAILFFLTACQTEVYRGLSQRDANEMIAVLVRNGIEAKREQADATTYRITVPEEKLGAAVDLLKRSGYPRENYQSLGDVFPGAGLIVSPYEQRIRMMYALNQEMNRSIMTIDGVVSSRVHVVLPELDLRGMPMNKPSASVIVHHRPDIDVVDITTKIRMLVSNGVQGLNYRDVSVSLFAETDGNERTAAQPASGERATTSSTAAPLMLDRPVEASPGLFQRIMSTLLWVVAGGMALVGGGLLLRNRFRRPAAPK